MNETHEIENELVGTKDAREAHEIEKFVVVDWQGFSRLEARLGPLVPVSDVGKLLGVSRRRPYRWIERGRVTVVVVWGRKFVPLLGAGGCHRLCAMRADALLGKVTNDKTAVKLLAA